MNLIIFSLLILSFFQSSVLAILRNCNLDPFSDHCDNIYTWQANDTCEEVAARFNETYFASVVHYNISTIDTFCEFLVEGEQICLDMVDYLSCGSYDICYFDNPEKFCDTYTVTSINTTCLDISELFNITVAEFEEFNVQNDFFFLCKYDGFYPGDIFCISKPDFSELDNCVAVAQHDYDTDIVPEMTETQTITPLDPDSGETEIFEYFYDTKISSYTTRSLNYASVMMMYSLEDAYDIYLDDVSFESDFKESLDAVSTSTFGTNNHNSSSSRPSDNNNVVSVTTSTATSESESASASTTDTDSNTSSTESTVSRGDAASLEMFGVAFIIALVSCLL